MTLHIHRQIDGIVFWPEPDGRGGVLMACRCVMHPKSEPQTYTVRECQNRLATGDVTIGGTNLAAVFAAFLAEHDR